MDIEKLLEALEAAATQWGMKGIGVLLAVLAGWAVANSVSNRLRRALEARNFDLTLTRFFAAFTAASLASCPSATPPIASPAASGQQHVEFTGARQRRNLLGEVNQFVGGVAHRANNDNDVIAVALRGHDPLGDTLNAVGIGDR